VIQEHELPTYEYACKACGQHIEVVQSMTDQPLRECGACGGQLRKVFSPIGIVFKGSGFYRTDSRSAGGNGSGASKPAASGSDSSSGEKSDSKSDSKSESKTESKSQGTSESKTEKSA
jgi:putative FmdB family regulatory protein